MNLSILRNILYIMLLAAMSAVAVAESEKDYLPELTTVNLFPTMRPESLSAALYILPTQDIAKYLENILVFDDMDEYETLPYVVGFDRDAKIGGTGDLAYTKGLHLRNDVSEFSFLYPGEPLEHPVTGEILGLEVFVIGHGVVKKFGPTQSIFIAGSERNIEVNTRMVPLTGYTLPATLEVKYPPKYMRAFVLSIPEMRELAGPYSVITITAGARDGMKQGYLLDIVEGDREVIDPNRDKEVFLPTAKVGEVVIFAVKEKISLGYITYATRTIVLGDELTVPIYVD